MKTSQLVLSIMSRTKSRGVTPEGTTIDALCRDLVMAGSAGRAEDFISYEPNGTAVYVFKDGSTIATRNGDLA